jgi:hypothetical protein
VTLLATKDTTGAPIATIDGSTWDPFAKRLIFTTESPSKPTYAATPGAPSTVEDVSGALGRGGYEGVQNDSAGNLWIVEDIGGATKPGAAVAKVPTASSTATCLRVPAICTTASSRRCRCSTRSGSRSR